jgi:hypothetical protein
MKTIKLLPLTGDFAENKDIARELRLKKINPYLKKGEKVTLDFIGITGATQSFVHALISELIRNYTDNVYDLLIFKNCSPTVEQIVNIVADYMEDGS